MDSLELRLHKVYDWNNKNGMDILDTQDATDTQDTQDEGCQCQTLEGRRKSDKELGLRYVAPMFSCPVPVVDAEEEIGKCLSEEEIVEYLKDTGQTPVVPMEQRITRECDVVKSMLLLKNKCYGNSAAEPIRVFSTSDSLEQMRVRIDDKLSRIAKGTEYPGDDTILDLIGYLVLYRILSKGD